MQADHPENELAQRLHPVIVRSAGMIPTATRRPGISERRLLGPADNPDQNWVLIDAEQGARVEEHVVQNSESFFVLMGTLQVFGPGFDEPLRDGDLCAFPAGAAHGVLVVSGPARFLVVFAPAGLR